MMDGLTDRASAFFYILRAKQGIGVIVPTPYPCPWCGIMTHFFRNHAGRTFCIYCPRELEEIGS